MFTMVSLGWQPQVDLMGLEMLESNTKKDQDSHSTMAVTEAYGRAMPYLMYLTFHQDRRNRSGDFTRAKRHASPHLSFVMVPCHWDAAVTRDKLPSSFISKGSPFLDFFSCDDHKGLACVATDLVYRSPATSRPR